MNAKINYEINLIIRTLTRNLMSKNLNHKLNGNGLEP